MMSFAAILTGQSPKQGGVSCGCRLETGMGPLCLARRFQAPGNTASRVCFSFSLSWDVCLLGSAPACS